MGLFLNQSLSVFDFFRDLPLFRVETEVIMKPLGFHLLVFTAAWSSLGFLLSRRLRRNDVADLLWGSGIATLVWSFAPGLSNLGLIQPLILVLVALWGVRLTAFLALRNLPEPEDSRYAAWRKEWGTREPWIAFLRVFTMQTVFALVVGMPAYLKLTHLSSAAPLTRIDAAFATLAFLGLLTEAVADAQLHRFRRSNPGQHRLMDQGLWRYSRHPNYFGEIIFWWGICGLGISSLETGAIGGCLLGTAFITFLLLKVSGVPMTERGMAKRRGAEYERYLAETSPLIPLPRGWYPRFFKKG
jgi:steroid 5-alpha reductase family enzyme